MEASLMANCKQKQCAGADGSASEIPEGSAILFTTSKTVEKMGLCWDVCGMAVASQATLKYLSAIERRSSIK